jgi:hypothetical protein
MFLAAIELEPEKTDSVPEPDHFRNNALELLEKLRIQIEKRNLRQSREQGIVIYLRKKSSHEDTPSNECVDYMTLLFS